MDRKIQELNIVGARASEGSEKLTHLFEKKRQNAHYSLVFMALRKVAYYNFSTLRRDFLIMA
ncbi:hypothetical protein, partial [Desulfobacter curvatus]|uniref:hypothetical protein n=1 Tax=Desulfobacter curvatus TaxID=2290 RepID=UPI001FDFDE1B